jgi:competence protein ComEC
MAAPFGLDGVFWWLMGIGIDWMVAVALWVAALPGSVGRIAAFGTGPLIAASLGIILMGLLRTQLRWSGALVLAVAVGWSLAVKQPDILIAGDGHSVAVRGRDRRLHLIETRKDAFLAKEWLAADADPRAAGDASLGDSVSCDEAGCVAPLADGRFIAFALHGEALVDDCSRASLVVTVRPAPADCAAVVIDRARLQRQGALALWRADDKDGFAFQAAKGRGTNRPWSPAIAGDGEIEGSLAPRPVVPRTKDATPPELDQQAED